MFAKISSNFFLRKAKFYNLQVNNGICLKQISRKYFPPDSKLYIANCCPLATFIVLLKQHYYKQMKYKYKNVTVNIVIFQLKWREKQKIPLFFTYSIAK